VKSFAVIFFGLVISSFIDYNTDETVAEDYGNQNKQHTTNGYTNTRTASKL